MFAKIKKIKALICFFFLSTTVNGEGICFLNFSLLMSASVTDKGNMLKIPTSIIKYKFLLKHRYHLHVKIDTMKDRLVSIRQLLETVYDDDQKYRNELEQLNMENPSGTAKKDSIWRLINNQDPINLKKVENVINQFGWLGPNAVGKKASDAQFFVLQHADLAVQIKYLPVLLEAVKQKKVSQSEFAYFIDRVEMRTGKPQTYGTQTTVLDNQCFMYPIRDVINIDKRRAEIGLSRLSDSFDGRDVKFNISPLTRVEEENRDRLLALLNYLNTENKKNVDNYILIVKNYGKGSKKEIEQKKTRQFIQLKLLKSVDSLLENNGWPSYTIIGMPGSSTIFSILSQADINSIKKYLPYLRFTVSKGEASTGHLAYLEDKVAVADGKPQLYGTQINNDKKPYPIENEKDVDKRRLILGLAPLKDYLKNTYGIDYQPFKN